MVTIRIGKKKVKIFNLLILIAGLFSFLYILGNLFFMLPFFKSEYRFNMDNGNYKLDYNTTFKIKYLSCIIEEKVKASSKEKQVYKNVIRDLKEDGYKNKNNFYVRKIKINKMCGKVKKEYKKVHNKNYLTFKLNGNSKDIVNYKQEYKDLYVNAVRNNKEIKDIKISSNYNENKVGTYVISYMLNVDKYYNRRLYRVVSVVDNVKPVITLIGDKKMVLEYGDSYKEPGFNAIDNYDGDITEKVKVRNEVNSKKLGTYKITYAVSDSNNNKNEVIREVVIKEKEKKVVKQEPVIEQKNGITYVDGVLLVNKKYGLPKDYDPKVNKEALKALERMQMDAKVLGLDLSLISGYRSYEKQKELYNKYVKEDGEEKANTYSAKPGHSEHQTGLAFDIGGLDDSFKYTDEAKWIDKNAHLYGFIVRYPKNKTEITGYIYEPWHVRYLGIDIASQVYNSGLCLEEYLGIN